MKTLVVISVFFTRLIFFVLWIWGIYIGWQVSWLAALLSTLPLLPTFYWAQRLTQFENGDLYISSFTATTICGIACFILSGIFIAIDSLINKAKTE